MARKITRMRRIVIVTMAAGIVLTGCSKGAGEIASASAPPAASAVLMNAQGQSRGTVAVYQTDAGIMVKVAASDLPPGLHGIHIHDVGLCEGPDFKTAGGHWNPAARQHGLENPMGSHMGDAPNLVIAEDGTGTLEFTVAGAQVSTGTKPMLGGNGAAVVVHEKADDQRTDPTGDSGGRIACGVLG